MEDFRKPYEYEQEDDKRGLVLMFIVMILAIDTFLSVSYMVQLSHVWKDAPILKNGFNVMGIAFELLVLYTVVTCYRLSKNFISVSKLYLFVRTVYMVIGMCIVFFTTIGDQNAVGNGSGNFKTTGELVMTILVAPLLYTVAFGVGWLLYFTRSKRCKEIVAARRANRPLQAD